MLLSTSSSLSSSSSSSSSSPTTPTTSSRGGHIPVAASSSSSSGAPPVLSLATPSVGNKLSDFEIVGEIGRGTYGTVYKVRSKTDHKLYVAKQIVLKNSKSSRRKRALAEALLLRELNHPFIVKYFTSFIQNESLYIIMEYAERGDLYKLYKRHKRKQCHFPERVLWKFTFEMATALDYLHDHRIIHRDLKCLNVFLGADKKIKIGDLGVSKIVGDDELLHTQAGTPAFFAPELVRKKPYDYKVDVWGLGCVLYQLAALQPPFEGSHVFELASNIVHRDPPVLSNFYSESFRNLVFKLLDKDPSKRICS